MKKIVSLVCVAALAVSMLAGCSSKKEETKAAETTAAATEESAGETTAAKDSGKLVMATEAGFAPYEYTEDGKLLLAWMWILPMKSQKRWVKSLKSRT